jgi:hypothetical protein
MSARTTLYGRRTPLSAIMLALLAFASPTIVGMATPPQAKAQIHLPLPCGIAPDGVAKDVCNTVANPLGAAANGVKKDLGKAGVKVPGIPNPADIVTDVAGQVAQHVLAPLINEFSDLGAAAMTYILREEFKYINSSTSVGLTKPWFIKLYALLAAAAVPLGLAVLIPRLRNSTAAGDYADVGLKAASFVFFLILAVNLPFWVGGITDFCDSTFAPWLLGVFIKDLNQVVNSSHVDFTKSMSLGNNPAAPILLPAIAVLVGTIGGFFTWIMFEVREPVLYALVILECFSAAMVVGDRWGNDSFVRSTMALLAWCLLKVIMAVLAIIGVEILGSSDATAVISGALWLALLPLLGWLFVKWMAGHRVSVMNSVFNARALASMVPGMA